MKNYRYMIAGGNTTLLIEDYFSSEKINIAQKALNEEFAEQVGFVDLESKIPTLDMMGNELCINATLAFASLTGQNSGLIKTSGVNNPVEFINQSGNIQISLELNYRNLKNIILFDSIGYFVTSKKVDGNLKTFLSKLAKEYDKAAFGIAYLNKNKLTPTVYVKKLDSLTEETSCGSGSIAAFLATKISNIVQTTGKTITIQKKGNRFTVQADVVKI